MEQENAEDLKFGPVFDKDSATALSNSEALQVLNKVHDNRKDQDATFVPNPMVQQTRQYLERFNTVKSMQAAEAIRQILSETNIKPFEQCSVINLLPSTAEEAKALLPSLEAVGDRFEDNNQLQEVLDRIAGYKDL